MIDVKHQISAVSRSLGTRELPAGQARVLTIAQTYDSAIADVWDACTNPDRIPRWFLPVSGDLTLGGRYQLEGNAGGVIERCDPPNSFAATWEMGGDISWIEVHLTDEGDGSTRFELEHIAHVDDERWLQFGPGAVGVGWDGALLGLARHLGTGNAVSPDEGMAWMMSAEGREFFGLSSDAWCLASVDAGTPPEQALAAADRTTAFYTGG
jgi:uncharacterized protein YndB with AHSA1/START domain